jgi:hypothetical protein
MATFSGLAVVRDDFRCSLCQRKNAFHCEHDTPYRDQLLGTYDQEKPRMSASNSRRESHRTSSHIHNNNLSNHNTQQKVTTGKNAGAPYQHGRKSETSTVSHTNTNPNSSDYVKTHEQKKKNKSCVIL